MTNEQKEDWRRAIHEGLNELRKLTKEEAVELLIEWGIVNEKTGIETDIPTAH